MSVIRPAEAPFVACTVISKNYVSHARVLATSFKAQHPDGRFVVLLSDKNDGYIDPLNEPFELLEVERLGIPQFLSMAMRYNVIELDTAVKPFFFRHLFAQHTIEKLVYFDPDIFIYRPLYELGDLLNQHAIILTPHFTSPVDDGCIPTEQTILLAGMCNLGFIAMRRSETVDRMLAWWSDRLARYCYVRVDQGLFVDQKWTDFLPSYFDDVHLLREPGYNAAYWNLHERSYTRTSPTEWMVNGKPLYFYHFSGFNPLKPESISIHQTRYTFATRPDIQPLFAAYRSAQLQAGYQHTSQWPYAYNSLSNGERITPHMRRAYDEHYTQHQWANPFDAQSPASFSAWFTHHTAHTQNAVTEEQKPVAIAHTPPLPQSWLERRHTWEPYQHFSRIIKLIIGPTAFYALQNIVVRHQLPSYLRARPQQPYHTQRQEGVNIIGHVMGELGLGEAIRNTITALDTRHVPLSLHDVDLGYSRKEDRTFASRLSANMPYDITIIGVNADTLKQWHDRTSAHAVSDTYRIGQWAWELERFPKEWSDRFDLVDEVWVPSAFVQQSIAPHAPCPVLTMPHAVHRTAPGTHNRAFFGIPQDAYVFLFMFDFFSVFERKNPLAVIQAFRTAFSQEHVRLVLKFSNAEHYPQYQHALKMEAMHDRRIQLIDGYLTKDQVSDLLVCCDAYVSLHRSEGFGLTMAEAMLFEKPVIATGYSGNMQFMDAHNSFPVRYSFQEITRDAGPYKRGEIWAEPDTADAARLMQHVYSNRADAQAKAAHARMTITHQFSPTRIGALLQERLEYIRLYKG